jgi:DNA mismatch repair ATPase MutL
VTTVVQALALGRPDVGFYLRSDGRGALALPPAADLRERVSQVHGPSLARGLVALEDPVVWGLVSPLEMSFPTRRHLHVAVNGRAEMGRLMAIADRYGGRCWDPRRAGRVASPTRGRAGLA